MPGDLKYLLTIPAHNEELTIGDVIKSFLCEADSMGLDLSVQVVDDHSTDDTRRIVRDMGISIAASTGSGLASAFRAEMQAALSTEADYIIHVDADGQHSATDLRRFIQKVSEGEEFILGNRLHTRPPGMPDLNYEGNIMLSRIVSVVVGLQISDTQTGYRVMSRRAAEYSKIVGNHTYTQEQIIRLAFAGFHIAEVPIVCTPRATGSSRLVKNGFKYMSRVFEDIGTVVSELKSKHIDPPPFV